MDEDDETRPGRCAPTRVDQAGGGGDETGAAADLQPDSDHPTGQAGTGQSGKAPPDRR